MKTGIHPELKKTKVTCLGCNTTFDTMSTVDTMTVELCSNCHPFYTGKQKLIDTAGRVDRFRAQQAKAQPAKATKKQPVAQSEAEVKDTKNKLAELKAEIATDTVDTKPVQDQDKQDQ